MFLNIKKYEFGVKLIKYFNLIIINNGIKIDLIKIEIIYVGNGYV